jgi:outer membrane protein assembly factor BamD
MKWIEYITLACAALSTGFFLGGCGSSASESPRTAQSVFAEAIQKFNNHDYLDALEDLDVIKLQYGGSTVADSAQFLQGECQFALEKYILAAYEFNVVRRIYTSSSLTRISQFKIAECYFYLSPDPALDQEYTQRAIDEYQAFLEIYGRMRDESGRSDSLVQLANERIKILHTRIGERYYKIAALYYKMDQYPSTIIYCDIVLDKYYDTDFADRALYLKIESLVEMKRFGEAVREIRKFISVYAASTLLSNVQSIQKSIKDKAQK